jgi:hypothetical protein
MINFTVRWLIARRRIDYGDQHIEYMSSRRRGTAAVDSLCSQPWKIYE